jgi:acyl carrier protein
MDENTYEVIRQALADQLRLDPSTISPESLITDDLGADSLDAVELIFALEERYGVNIEAEDADNLITVHDIVALVDRLRDC